MTRNRRLSVALHALLHLAETAPAPRTSEELAACVGTNPVVIRRTLAGLREAGLVRSVPGHGGGWSLAGEASQISLGSLCRALGERVLLAVDLAAPSGCAVQASLTDQLGDLLDDVEALLLERLDRVPLASLCPPDRRRGASSRTGDDHVH